MKHSTWWWLSVFVSLLLAALLIKLWSEMNEYHIERTQLTNQKSVNDY